MDRRRAYELDLLRVVAAVAVVAFHLTCAGHGFNGVSVGYPRAVTDVSRYGFLGVELFFFISGYVILTSARGRSAGSFAAARAWRLYPAYVVAVTVSFLVARAAEPERGLSVGDWLVGLTMVQSFVGRPDVDGVYWTLAAELVFYAVVAVVLRFDRGLARLPAVLGGWLVVAMLLTRTSDTGRIGLAAPWAPFFVAGCALALLRLDRRDRVAQGLLLAALAGALITTVDETRRFQQPWSGASPTVAALVVAASFGLLAVVASGRIAGVGRPWMAVAGAWSYPLYLLHDRNGYVLLERFSGLGRWADLAVVVAIVVAASALLHHGFERPVARWRRGRARGSARPVVAVAGPA